MLTRIRVALRGGKLGSTTTAPTKTLGPAGVDASRSRRSRRPVLVGEREEGLPNLKERSDQDGGWLVANESGGVHDVIVVEQA